MKTTITTLLTAIAFIATASADLLVYEGFDYGAASSSRTGADLLHGQPDASGGDTDATGLSGTWQDTSGPGETDDSFMYSGSLSFSSLPTSGNSVRTDTNNNNDIFDRSVTSDLDGSSELWFSFLADKLQNNNRAAEGGVLISNQTVGDAKIVNNGDGLAGFGIAPTGAGNDWTFYGWDGTSQTTGDASVSASIGVGDVHLLIGKVSFNTGSGGADQFALYDAGDDGDLGTDDFVQIGSTMEVDIDDTVLDTLVVTRQVNTAYDEIRVATTGEEVIGIPEPSTLALALLGLAGLVARRR